MTFQRFYEDDPDVVGHLPRRAAHFVGRAIREARERRGLTQADVAALLACSPAIVSHWEAARRELSLANIWALSRILDVEVSDLLPPVQLGTLAEDLIEDLVHWLGVVTDPGSIRDALLGASREILRPSKPRPRAVTATEAARELVGAKPSWPIDIEAIALACGVHVLAVKWTPDHRLRGFFTAEPTPAIIVQQQLEAPQARFTIARALGHWALNDEPRFFDLGPDAEGQQVRPMKPGALLDLNEFATEVLMPVNAVRRARYDIGSIDYFAETFRVPTLAMALRLRYLGIEGFV